jgi:hypothetical protein
VTRSAAAGLLAWWNDVTLGADLGVAGASHNEVDAAMDWLLARQDTIGSGPGQAASKRGWNGDG